MRFLIVFLCISNGVWSQNLEKHQWKERVIVIAANAENIDEAEQQFELFLKKREELIDRRIVLYKCIKKQCTFYNWKDHPKTMRVNTSHQVFKIELIGLDGGLKYQSNTIEKPQVVLDLIDLMPMRRQELKANTKND